MINLEDKKRIEFLAKQNFKSGKILEIKRLGGLSNRNYYVKIANLLKSKPDTIEEFVFRLPGFGTELITDRKDEKISTQLANKIGIDSKLVYFDDKTGEKIAYFIKNSTTMNPESLKKEENIILIAQTFKKLHNSNFDTKIPFDIIKTIENYEKIINQNKIEYFSDYFKIKDYIYPFALKEFQNKNKVPCHNDPVCENWILQDENGKKKMFLIDWEYGGMNNPIWDLALVSSEAHYTDEQDEILLKEYYNKNIVTKEYKKLIINKIIIDFYLSLWAKTRIIYDGELMVDYSCEHYNKMKNNIEILKKL